MKKDLVSHLLEEEEDILLEMHDEVKLIRMLLLHKKKEKWVKPDLHSASDRAIKREILSIQSL